MTKKKLTRSREQKAIAGVCGGIAEYSDVDVVLVRLIAVAGLFVSAGSMALVYLIAWIIMPKAPETPWHDITSGPVP